MKKPSFITKFLVVFGVFVFSIQTIRAQMLPPIFDDLLNDDVIKLVFNRVQVGFLILLGVFLALIVFYIVRGLMKYAQDDKGDIGDATKIMQRNMIAVGGVFVGVLGVAVVLIFFGINPEQIQPHQICLNSPDSYGCYACTENPSTSTLKDQFSKVCSMCDNNENAQLDGPSILCNTSKAEGSTKSQIEAIIEKVVVEE